MRRKRGLAFLDWIVDHSGSKLNRSPWKSRKYRDQAIGEIVEMNPTRNRKDLISLPDPTICRIWYVELLEEMAAA